jgi:hypothetical protein
MSSPRRTKKPTSRTPRRRTKPARDFWGTEHPEDHGPTLIRAVDHPTALIHSLGAPPLPNGAVAQHYFDAIYERAAALAIALATSAGLSETGDPD